MATDQANSGRHVPKFPPLPGSLAAAAWPTFREDVAREGLWPADLQPGPEISRAFVSPAANWLDVEAKLRAIAEFRLKEVDPVAAGSPLGEIGQPVDPAVELDDFYDRVLWQLLADVIRLNGEAARG